MSGVVELLIAKEEERVALEGLPDSWVAIVRRHAAQIDILDFDAEAEMERQDSHS
jgi:hypothetical protein